MIDYPVVYCVSAAEVALVKIGYSRCLPRRLVALVQASPVDLRLVRAVPGGAALERDLHDRFEAYWVRREWFRMAGALRDFLADASPEERQAVDETQARVFAVNRSRRPPLVNLAESAMSGSSA